MSEHRWYVQVTEATDEATNLIASFVGDIASAGLTLETLKSQVWQPRFFLVEATLSGDEASMKRFSERCQHAVVQTENSRTTGDAFTIAAIDCAPVDASQPSALQLLLDRLSTIRDVEISQVRPVGGDSSNAHEMEVLAPNQAILHDQVLQLRQEHASFEAGLYRSSLRRGQRLIVFDVDSTLIEGEMIDELAALAGRQSECSAITQAAMSGRVPFDTALRERVALLEGLPSSALTDVQQRLELAPGTRGLLQILRRLGYKIALISGGFNQIVESAAHMLGADHFLANELEICRGRLTGRVIGPIVDGEGKARGLRSFAAYHGLPLRQVVAVGDGANDALMLEAAGLGVAYGAKEVARMSADATLPIGKISELLCYLGIGPSHLRDIRDLSTG